jgi:hypothetical protein
MCKQLPGFERVIGTGGRPLGEESNDPLDNHKPAEQGMNPNDLLCRPAA